MRKLRFFAALFLFATLLVNCKKEKKDPEKIIEVKYEDSIKNGLWAYYNFNNNNLKDLSGNSRHMSGANGIDFSYDMWGETNNALQFDGFDDYAVIDEGRNFPEGDFTISFLMMPKVPYGRVFQKANFNDGKAASFGFGFDQDLGSQKMHFYVSKDNDVCNKLTDPSNATILAVNKAIYPYAWYMVAIQHTNGLQNVYVNGNLTSSQATPNKSFKNCTTAPFYFGMWWLQDRRAFAGKIDELRIYTRALNDKEIKYLFERLP